MPSTLRYVSHVVVHCIMKIVAFVACSPVNKCSPLTPNSEEYVFTSNSYEDIRI